MPREDGINVGHECTWSQRYTALVAVDAGCRRFYNGCKLGLRVVGGSSSNLGHPLLSICWRDPYLPRPSSDPARGHVAR